MEITKDLANDVANKMTAKLKEKAYAYYEQARLIVAKEFENDTPKEIIQIAKKHPLYFNMYESVSLQDNGNHKRVDFPVPNVPKIYNSGIPLFNNGNYMLSELKDAEVGKLLQKKDELLKKRRDLISSIEATLYDLRTYKNVEEQFPQALEFFPEIAVKKTII